MALDDSRLGVGNKFLENKSGRIFTFDRFSFERVLYEVSFSGLRPLRWQHRIHSQAVILSFLIIFS